MLPLSSETPPSNSTLPSWSTSNRSTGASTSLTWCVAMTKIRIFFHGFGNESPKETLGRDVQPVELVALRELLETGAAPPGMNALDGRIAGRTFAGNLLHVHVDIDDGTKVVLEARPQDPLGEDGSAIRLRWRPCDTIVLTR